MPNRHRTTWAPCCTTIRSNSFLEASCIQGIRTRVSSFIVVKNYTHKPSQYLVVHPSLSFDAAMRTIVIAFHVYKMPRRTSIMRIEVKGVVASQFAQDKPAANNLLQACTYQLIDRRPRSVTSENARSRHILVSVSTYTHTHTKREMESTAQH